MEKCWASCLGDCEGGMSREHIISQSLFNATKIQVSGYPWCKDKPMTIGLRSFTKKALCRQHNSDLSTIDAAGAHAFDVIRRHTQLSIERGKTPDKRHRRISLHLDATRLELWLLKTLINISYGGEHFIGPTSQRAGFPSDDLVRMIFRGKPIPPENGMFIVSKPGLDLHMSDRVEMMPLIHNNKYIHGGFFKFFGLPMFLDLVPGGMQFRPDVVPYVPSDWHDTERYKHFREFKATIRGRVSHVVKFNWR